MGTFSNDFELDLARLDTKRDCYNETVELATADIDHAAILPQANFPLGEFNSMTFENNGVQATLAAASWQMPGPANGSGQFTFTFERPVDATLGFAGLGGGEFVTLITPGFELNLSGAGAFNAANNRITNNNSNNTEEVTWRGVTEIRFNMQTVASIGSVGRIVALRSAFDFDVVCSALEDGEELRTFAIIDKTDIVDITETGIADTWTLKPSTAPLIAQNVTSNRVGEFLFMKSGSDIAGLLPVVAGTVANGATNNPVWAAMYPEFVSDADIVFPDNVDGMFLRNLGGNAGLEGIFQSDGTAVNGLSGSVRAPDPTVSNNTAGGGGNNIRNAAADPLTLNSSDPETRPVNRAYQLYTVLDSYNDVVAADGPYVATASIPIQNMNVTGVVALTQDIAETPWTIIGNQASFAGSPKFVKISAQVYQRIADAANIQRAAPILDLERWDGNAWQVVATGATGYIRDTSDHEDSSNTIIYRDTNPIVNPMYRLASRLDTTNTGAVNSIRGQFDLEALGTSDSADTRVPTTPTFPADTGQLQVFNSQDGDNGSAFNLQIGNQVNAVSNFEALYSSVPYATIPALNLPAGVIYETLDNGDGTFNHLFRAFSVPAFQNTTITGGVPSPAGNGDDPLLFYQAA